MKSNEKEQHYNKTNVYHISNCYGIRGCRLVTTQPKQEIQPESLEKVTVVLDWTPNTSTIPACMWQMRKVSSKEHGLEVEIIQPSEVQVIQLLHRVRHSLASAIRKV